jgi:hypothetical protein
MPTNPMGPVGPPKSPNFGPGTPKIDILGFLSINWGYPPLLGTPPGGGTPLREASLGHFPGDPPQKGGVWTPPYKSGRGGKKPPFFGVFGGVPMGPLTFDRFLDPLFGSEIVNL